MRLKQDFAPKTKPLPHQTEAIEYIANHDTSALFDEQGLGKTKIAIDALSRNMESGIIEAALIVAPLSLVHVWEHEVLKHSHLIPMVLRGSSREKRYKFMSGANFYLTNYEAVVAEVSRIRRLCTSRKIAIVLDEAARVKDPTTQTARALFQIAPLVVKRLILTGTPVANKPCDLWAQFYFLNQGSLLGDNYSAFATEYNERNIDFPCKLEHLRDIISKNSMRRLKTDVLQLPDKEFRLIPVKLEGRQMELYTSVRDLLRMEIANTEGQIIIEQVDNILEKLLRLVQIASNPYLVDKGYQEVPGKFPILQEIVKSCISRDEKIIIWTSFVDNIRALKRLFAEFNPLLIYGDVPTADRADIVIRFQENERNKILIANPSAAREGLTLTRANNAVYLDRNFNLVDYLQSQDRIHRISQTKECTIYKLVAEGTIDEYVDLIVDIKTDIAKFLQGDTHSLDNKTIQTIADKKNLLKILGG